MKASAPAEFGIEFILMIVALIAMVIAVIYLLPVFLGGSVT